MRQLMRITAVLSLATLVACAEVGTGPGDGGDLGPLGQNSDPGQTPEGSLDAKVDPNAPQPVSNDEPDTEPLGSRRVDLRVRGVNASWPVQVSMRSFVAHANGMQLPVALATGPMVFDSRDHAWRVGSVELPEGVESVRFTARFTAAGAIYEGHSSRHIDLSGAPMVFTSSADHLLSRHKLVIDLDVNRSLEEEELGATVLPHFNVRY